MNDLLYCFPRSDRELELEISLDRTFTLLRRNPQLKEINLGASYLSNQIAMEQLVRLSYRHGLEFEVRESGRVAVWKPTKEPSGQQSSSVISRGAAAIWHEMELALHFGRALAGAHVPNWNAGFDGLTEGIR